MPAAPPAAPPALPPLAVAEAAQLPAQDGAVQEEDEDDEDEDVENLDKPPGKPVHPMFVRPAHGAVGAPQGGAGGGDGRAALYEFKKTTAAQYYLDCCSIGGHIPTMKSQRKTEGELVLATLMAMTTKEEKKTLLNKPPDIPAINKIVREIISELQDFFAYMYKEKGMKVPTKLQTKTKLLVSAVITHLNTLDIFPRSPTPLRSLHFVSDPPWSSSQVVHLASGRSPRALALAHPLREIRDTRGLCGRVTRARMRTRTRTRLSTKP